MHLPVDADHVYTGRCFSRCEKTHFASICICFSSGVPAILPYLKNQSCFSGFHLPPAALACSRACISATLMCRGTRVSAVYRGRGGVHASLSTISSTVFSRCRDSASYRKRTHNRESPYFFVRLFVPRCPGLRISRVLIQFPADEGVSLSSFMIFLKTELTISVVQVNEQIKPRRLAQSRQAAKKTEASKATGD